MTAAPCHPPLRSPCRHSRGRPLSRHHEGPPLPRHPLGAAAGRQLVHLERGRAGRLQWRGGGQRLILRQHHALLRVVGGQRRRQRAERSREAALARCHFDVAAALSKY